MEIETTRPGLNKLLGTLKVLLKDSNAVLTLVADEDSDHLVIKGNSETLHLQTSLLAEVIESGTAYVKISDLIAQLPKGQTLTLSSGEGILALESDKESTTVDVVEDFMFPPMPDTDSITSVDRADFLQALANTSACTGNAASGLGLQNTELSFSGSQAIFTATNLFVGYIQRVQLSHAVAEDEKGIEVNGAAWQKALAVETATVAEVIATSDRSWVGVEVGDSKFLFRNQWFNMPQLHKVIEQVIEGGFTGTATYPAKEALAALMKNKKSPLVAVQYNENLNGRMLFKDSDKQPILIDSKGDEGVRSFVVTPANLMKLTQALNGEDSILHFPANKFRPILVAPKGVDPRDSMAVGVIMTVDTKGERANS